MLGSPTRQPTGRSTDCRLAVLAQCDERMASLLSQLPMLTCRGSPKMPSASISPHSIPPDALQPPSNKAALYPTSASSGKLQPSRKPQGAVLRASKSEEGAAIKWVRGQPEALAYRRPQRCAKAVQEQPCSSTALLLARPSKATPSVPERLSGPRPPCLLTVLSCSVIVVISTLLTTQAHWQCGPGAAPFHPLCLPAYGTSGPAGTAMRFTCFLCLGLAALAGRALCCPGEARA